MPCMRCVKRHNGLVNYISVWCQFVIVWSFWQNLSLWKTITTKNMSKTLFWPESWWKTHTDWQLGLLASSKQPGFICESCLIKPWHSRFWWLILPSLFALAFYFRLSTCAPKKWCFVHQSELKKKKVNKWFQSENCSHFQHEIP